MTAYLNEVAKYVVSSTMGDPGWRNTIVLAGDPVEEVEALKSKQGKDIVLTGSIRLAHTLISAGLVDEYRLFTYPAIQGRGRGQRKHVRQSHLTCLVHKENVHGIGHIIASPHPSRSCGDLCGPGAQGIANTFVILFNH